MDKKTIEIKLSEGFRVKDTVLCIQQDTQRAEKGEIGDMKTVFRLWIERNRKEITPVYVLSWGDMLELRETIENFFF